MQNMCPPPMGRPSYLGSEKNPWLRADSIMGLVGREKAEHLNYFAADVSAIEEGKETNTVKTELIHS